MLIFTPTSLPLAIDHPIITAKVQQPNHFLYACGIHQPFRNPALQVIATTCTLVGAWYVWSCPHSFTLASVSIMLNGGILTVSSRAIPARVRSGPGEESFIEVAKEIAIPHSGKLSFHSAMSEVHQLVLK